MGISSTTDSKGGYSYPLGDIHISQETLMNHEDITVYAGTVSVSTTRKLFVTSANSVDSGATKRSRFPAAFREPLSRSSSQRTKYPRGRKDSNTYNSASSGRTHTLPAGGSVAVDS